MNTINKNLKVNVKKVVVVMVAITICFAILPGFKSEARAGKGGAFLGGMVAGHVLTGFVDRDKRRTRAEEYQAYSQPRTVQQAAPAPSAPMTPATPATQPTAQQRLAQLDKLAAGGYITPEEYKAKKKAILDGI
jgi:hypothetical protein